MRPDPDQIERASELLRSGGLVAFPTETVYGLGADASNAEAVQRIFKVKRRPTEKPLIVHIAKAEMLDDWAIDVPPTARVLADAFWPGPLTVILRRGGRVVDAVTGGRVTIGLRVPDHSVARELLDAFGGGVAAPSANRFGHVSPTTAADVRTELGAEVDAILDGGPCVVGVESTIIDLTGDEPEVLRPGGVSLERLSDVLEAPMRLWRGDDSSRAPGMTTAHYAPSAKVELIFDGDLASRATECLEEGLVVGALAPEALGEVPDGIIELEPAGPPEEYARVLYSRLRQADRLGLDILLVVPPPDEGVGSAIRDRLIRASSPRM